MACPRVKFHGERGIDAGGLRREYGNLLRQQVFSSNAGLFEGIEKRKLPVYSVEAIQSEIFFVVGKMIAYLIVHLDLAVPCFSPAIYNYIASGNVDGSSAFCEARDLPDIDMQKWILQVHNTHRN